MAKCTWRTHIAHEPPGGCKARGPYGLVHMEDTAYRDLLVDVNSEARRSSAHKGHIAHRCLLVDVGSGANRPSAHIRHIAHMGLLVDEGS